MGKRIYIIVLFIGFSVAMKAQESATKNVEQIIADIYEQVVENSESDIDFTSFYEDLAYFVENPINLNNAKKEELEKLQFLTDTQIDNILYYIYRFSPLYSIYEIQLIDGFDMTDIQQLLPFVRIGTHDEKRQKLQFSNIFRYGKSEILFRLDKGLETKEGYRFYPEEEGQSTNERKYIGNPFYNHVKYRFKYRDRISFGVTGEKDAGEQFWGKEQKGYDFYSAHLELKNFGKMRTFVAGDYRANFGQGLIFKTDFSMGKSSYVLQVNSRTNGLKKYTSTDEYNFLRGVGATFRLKNIDITAFYSNKMIDGDTVGGTFSSIKKDGLHRTFPNFSKKQTIKQQVIGGNFIYNYSWFQAGLTVVHTNFDQELTLRAASYNQFYFQGKEQTAMSLNYRFRINKISIFGETGATNKKNGIGTINGFDFSPTSKVGLVALFRYFSKEFDPIFGNTFSESSRVNNERGVYMGTEIRPFRFWKFAAYIDSYRFDWMRFGVDNPSFGKDYLAQATFSPKRNVSMYWRYKYKEKQHNFSDTTTVMPFVTNQPHWSARYWLSYSFGQFSFKNQLDMNGFNDGINPSTFGYSAFQDVSYRLTKIPLTFDFRFHVFDARNFENRIYTYEKDVLYAFSIPMNYGLGTRYYVNLKYDILSNFTLWMKLSQTAYADNRSAISSGNELIEGNRKTDFRILLRYKF